MLGIGIGINRRPLGAANYAKQLAKAYEARVIADGGVVESLGCFTAFAKALGASKPTFDADAQAFFNRVTTAGGLLSTTEQSAVNALVVRMKADGIWSKMKAIYPMVGASAAACSQNLKSSSFTGAFTSGWTFASTGVTPNGTSAYMNTNLNISTNLNRDNTHVSFYSRTSLVNDSFGAEMGGSGSYSFDASMSFRIRNATSGSNYWSLGQDNGVSLNSTNGLGFHIGISTASNVRKLYRNGTNTATGTNTNNGTLPNQTVVIGASHLIYSKNQCAFASIGDGLTDTEASNFYTAVQAFQTTLSRQV